MALDKNEEIWKNAIADTKFIINNKIARIFPKMNNHLKYQQIKIDEESLTYITIREIADITSRIIMNYLLKYNMNPNNVTIADYTAGVGGNVLSFAKYFKCVHAVELNKQREEYLKNNVDVYGFKNIITYNTSCIEFNKHICDSELNVIFMDPPWGGENYKNVQELQIVLKDNDKEITLEELLINIIENLKQTKHYNKFDCYKNKFIFLKLPLNYNIEAFFYRIKDYCSDADVHILQKMLIVAITL